jgi:hypothetical protein
MENMINWGRAKAKTAAAGTAIFVTAEPLSGGRLVVPRVSVTCGDTDDLLIVGTAKDYSTVSGNFVAGATEIKSLTDLTFTAGDRICVKSIDSDVYSWLTVSARTVNPDGTVDLTVDAIPVAINNGSTLYYYGNVLDAEHDRYPLVATETVHIIAEDGFFGSGEMDAPIFFYVVNGGGTACYFLGATVIEINK